jgi:hypothetical protein
MGSPVSKNINFIKKPAMIISGVVLITIYTGAIWWVSRKQAIQFCASMFTEIMNQYLPTKDTGSGIDNAKSNELSEEDKDIINSFSFPLFREKKDADRLLKACKDYISIYGVVTIGDIYNILGDDAPYEAFCYGWTQNNLFMVSTKPNGYYFVDAGDPSYID